MTSIDLTHFCGKHDVRSYINAPFSILGGTGATNGLMLVWMDKDLSAKPLGDKEPKRLGHMINKAREDAADPNAQWIAVDTIRTSSRECTECAGTGKVTLVDCDDCDGEGDFWHGSHCHACKECDGAGNKNETGIGEQCDECGGSGKNEVSQPSSYGSGGFTVASHFIARMRTLPNCKLRRYDSRPDGGCTFAFDGGVGIVMPLLREPIA